MPRDGTAALLLAFGTALGLAGLSYAHPALENYRPWTPGDPVPVIAALVPKSEARVVEDVATGELIAAPEVVELPATTTPGLPARPPGVPTPLVDAGHRGMDRFYRALARKEGLARVAHYGDSTIAADGISGTVRSRLQARFGNGGPGYLSAGMDPRWNTRPDVHVGRHGEWETVSLLGGNGGGRYGYGGIASTALADAYVTFHPAAKTPLHHFEVWYRGGEGGGNWWSSVDGKGSGSGGASASATFDNWHTVDIPEGYVRAAVGATGGPVTFYGVVMETKGPGVVWDALGVVGVGTKSFTQYNKKHLARQIEKRNPDLVVMMLGGNELGYPVLSQGDGSGYVPYYQGAIRMIRAGAPQSSCLVVTPLDQGTRESGAPKTKPALLRAVKTQAAIAQEEGCAFWNAFAAMGGEGSIVRWGALRPPMAWSDLLHLSTAGQEVIGQLLADAIEAGFDEWSAGGGLSRAAPPPPGPPA